MMSYLDLNWGVGKLVGESGTTDGDSSQDPVALVLVHHQAGLDASRLLGVLGTTQRMKCGSVL